MNALNTTRASAKCYALARQRLVSHGQYNNYRRSRCCFSSLQHDTQLMASTIDRDDDDEQHNKMHSRAIYQYPPPTIHPSHPSLLYNTSCTIVGTTINNNNNNYNNSNFTTTTIRRQQQYYYSTTPSKERGAAIVMTLGAIAATAKAGQYAVQGYNEWKEGRDLEMKEQEKLRKENNGEEENAQEPGASKSNTNGASDSSTSTNNTQSSGTNEKRENIFAKFFDLSVGSKYYEGGFEDKMTRKEAALILGVRESSAPKRIKEAHRKLLILNHPDTGGSTFIAGKINEAKELLLKGKK